MDQSQYFAQFTGEDESPLPAGFFKDALVLLDRPGITFSELIDLWNTYNADAAYVNSLSGKDLDAFLSAPLTLRQMAARKSGGAT